MVNKKTANLHFPYNTGFTREERIEIDKKTQKSRENFTRGFRKTFNFSLKGYFLYKLVNSVAYAVDLPKDLKNILVVETLFEGPTDRALEIVNGPKSPYADVISDFPSTNIGDFPLTNIGELAQKMDRRTMFCMATLQNSDYCLGAFCGLLLFGSMVAVGKQSNLPPNLPLLTIED